MAKLLTVLVLAVLVSFVVSKSFSSLLRANIDFALEKNEGNIVEVATSLGLNDLVKLAAKAGLAETLETKGPFTVFGPTDLGFEKLPPNVKELLSNVTILKGVLEYHVVEGKVLSSGLKDGQVVTTLLSGFNFRVNIFKKSSGTVYTAACQVISKPDQMASNGVIHVLDGVMLPPGGTIPWLLKEEKDYFSTLLSLVELAKLAETLEGPGPFTLFAPINAAFAKLDPALVKKLMNDLDLLKKVLLYHVVSGSACSAGLEDGMEVPTVEGASLKVSISGGTVKVGPAKVVYADANVSNGVVHVIDTVLIPPTL